MNLHFGTLSRTLNRYKVLSVNGLPSVFDRHLLHGTTAWKNNRHLNRRTEVSLHPDDSNEEKIERLNYKVYLCITAGLLS
jgi:hypothetical protein